ncbi:MAG: hypothetical protein P1R58_07820, partial [bacterium]|nr:hypothetical protein [bacterium]
IPTLAIGQDLFGARDTVFADVDKIADDVWTVTVSITNDEDVEGLSVPLRLSAGDNNKIVADSAIYVGGRVEHFALKAFRPDTAIQCVTLGMVANLGPTANKLTPGDGRLVTVFISSLEDKPIEMLSVDTTTTHPNNFLMVVASRSNWGEHSLDTIPIEKRKELEISPVFMVRTRK